MSRPPLASTFLTSVLLPTTATLAEDGFALVGRGIARNWRAVTFRGRIALNDHM